MRSLDILVLVAIVMGCIEHSDSTPSNNWFNTEKPIPSNKRENKNSSFLFFTSISAADQQSKVTKHLVNENKSDDERSVTTAGEIDEVKKLQETHNRFEKRGQVESIQETSLSSGNLQKHLERTENDIASIHGVKTRIRRNIAIDETYYSEYDDDDDDDDEDYEDSNTDFNNSLDGPNGVSNITTTTANKIVVRKCCPNGETFHQSRGLCSRSQHTMPKHFQANSTTGIHLQYIDSSPCAFGGHRLHPHKDKYSVSDEGFLSFGNRILSPEEFCFETFLDKEEVYPVVCYKDISSVYVHIIIGKALTIPFLIITLFVYMFIAELHSAFGIAVLCHTATLLFAYITFIVVEHVHPYMTLTGCRSYAFVIFIMFQSSFFWLNVMCYDLCWFISMLKTLSKNMKIILYSCYAWGTPLILMIVLLHREIVPGIPGYHLKPEYGKGGCRYSANLDHFYPPVILLQVCNIILFAGTFFQMLCRNRGKQEGQRQQLVQDKQHYNMYILYFKFVLVKGMITVPLIIMWILDAQIIMWYLINIQEIFICIALVFNDNIMNLLNKRKYISSHEFSDSFQQKPPRRYSTQDMEANSNTSSSPNHSDTNKSSTVLKMKTFDTNNQENVQ